MNNIINRTRNIMNKININIVVRYVCVWLFVIQFIPSVVAQTEEEVYNEKVVVISGYQPVLQESEKIMILSAPFPRILCLAPIQSTLFPSLCSLPTVAKM